MARWRFTVDRELHERSYEQVPKARKFAHRVKLKRAAEAAGATLRSELPVMGWVSNRLSRDGKDWPCAQGAQGARRTWMWTGDV